MIEPPAPPVGQDRPLRRGVAQVDVYLVARVLDVEAADPLLGLIERYVPGFGVADGHRPEIKIVALPAIVGLSQAVEIGKEAVIWPVCSLIYRFLYSEMVI